MVACPSHLIAPGLPGYLGVRQRFSLPSYLSTVNGAYWDFTKTDGLFQENTGPTSVANIGDPIGLALDRGLWGGNTLSGVLAGQSELLVPGSWLMSTAGGSSTATNSPVGTLNLTGDGTNQARGDQSFATVVGGIYKIASTMAGPQQARLQVGTSQGGVSLLNVVPALGASAYYVIATSTTTWVRFSIVGPGSCSISGISSKLVPGIPATQATGTQKPTFQTSGGKFDGADDNLLTSYLAGAGSNFIVALVTVPASLAADQIFVGSRSTTDTRFFLGIRATTGKLGYGVGSIPFTDAGGDLRGADAVVGLSIDGSTVRVFSIAALATEVAQTGAIQTTVPLRLGAFNDNGTASTYFGGSIKRIATGRDFLTLSRYLQIRSALLAG